jgi:uncharacterized ParB-like nuclease family protein
MAVRRDLSGIFYVLQRANNFDVFVVLHAKFEKCVDGNRTYKLSFRCCHRTQTHNRPTKKETEAIHSLIKVDASTELKNHVFLE